MMTREHVKNQSVIREYREKFQLRAFKIGNYFDQGFFSEELIIGCIDEAEVLRHCDVIQRGTRTPTRAI